jgi:uncharacterized membrane protein
VRRGGQALVPSLPGRPPSGLIIFFIAVLPANIHAARANVTLGGEPATPLVLRLPMQLLFIVLTWWSAVRPARRPADPSSA